MDEHKGQGGGDSDHVPHGHRDRDSAHEQPRKSDTTTRADSHDSPAAGGAADLTFSPDREDTDA